mmetsp:Transcript_66065/g.99590  ORF Transcript_66065/g.99590 Transcript_66065/m.99590 type:complete len:943 (-) Transcript_66065:97-2925(-)
MAKIPMFRQRQKKKWGMFGNILGKRQNPPIKSQKQASAQPVGRQGPKKPKGADAPKKNQSAPSQGKKNHIQKKNNPNKPERAGGVKSKTAAVPKKNGPGESVHKNIIQSKSSSEKSRYPADVLPSFPSKSLDSDIDQGSKTDRYKSTQFKKSEEKNHHVSFDHSVLPEEKLESVDSDVKPGNLSVETKAPENATNTETSRDEAKVRTYQDLHIQQGMSAEYKMKSLNTNDWDENVHRHPSQSLSIETSNDDWDDGVNKLPAKTLDPIVSDQASNGETTRSKLGMGERNEGDDPSTHNHQNNISAEGKPQNAPEKTDESETQNEGAKDEMKRHYAPALGSSDDDIQKRDDRIQRSPEQVLRPSYQGQTADTYGIQGRRHGNIQGLPEGATRIRNPQDTLTKSHNRNIGDLSDSASYHLVSRGDGIARNGRNTSEVIGGVKPERRMEEPYDYSPNAGENIPSRQQQDRHGPMTRPLVAETAVEPVYTDGRRTKTEDDSLINFVISPGRLELPPDIMKINSNARDFGNVVTPPVKPRYTTERQTAVVNETPGSQTTTMQPMHKEIKPESKNPRIIARIAGIFGSKSKNKKQPNKAIDPRQPETNDDDQHIETSASDEKDLEQAISDGNMRAVEANENAEDAPVSGSTKKNKKVTGRSTLERSPIEHMSKSARREESKTDHVASQASSKVDRMKHRSSAHADHSKQRAKQGQDDSLSQAIRKGSSKAEETNDNSEDAPLLQHLRSLKRKQQVGRNSEKGGERRHRSENKASSGTDRRKTDPGPKAQPIRSRRKDPSNDKTATSPGDGAPTPRRSDKLEQAPTPRRSDTKMSSDDMKYDQKAITARLYGGKDSPPSQTTAVVTRSEPSHKTREQSHKTSQERRQRSHPQQPRKAAKHVYIGDLVDSNPARTLSTQDSEDSFKETKHRPADPSVCGERRKVRRGTDPS